MAFKIGGPSSISVENPERMFLDFSDRKFKGLLTHQGRVLSDYQDRHLGDKDVAIRLPTGSGKTLVGILLAEWRRRTRDERAVYVCPTRQLVHQVVKEASEKYGMADWVHAFVGKQQDYDVRAKAKFHSGELVAVTTYGGLFNANTFFSEPNFIVFDDAHAAENYIASYWTLGISRNDHKSLFAALGSVLRPVINNLDFKRLTEQTGNAWDNSWVDMVPSTAIETISSEIISVLDEHTKGTSLRYSWNVLREHLRACGIFISAHEIMVRPFIPPTMKYAPFAAATQRVYMSATLGEGGDLERLTGVKRIQRLNVPDDFNAHGVGRRFMVLPGRSLSEEEQVSLQCTAISKVGRAVVLAPDFRTAEEIEASILRRLPVPVFNAKQIEESKEPFVSSSRGVAILANRYDGIDFPDEQCRLLIMRGLPGAANLQERFLSAKMGARLLLSDRIRTRFVQAVGRCTRSATDYSAVILLGEDLLTYVSKIETRSKLHSELQAEVQFGLDQSGTETEMLENLDLFYARGDEWRAADNEIRRLRGQLRQEQAASMGELAASSVHEVEFQYALWDQDYRKALEASRGVLTELKDPALQGYRALWSYFAGNAATYLSNEGVSGLDEVGKEYFEAAAKSATAVSWLRKVSGIRAQDVVVARPAAMSAPLIERLEAKLDQLGTKHDQRFAILEKMILDGANQSEAAVFERAQKELGELLGFQAGKVESQGSPDPWWLVDDSLCFVFEDYTDTNESSLLSIGKARQVASHPNWIREHLGLDSTARVLPILVSPVEGAEKDAGVHLQNVLFWPLADYRRWVHSSLQTIRQLRITYPGPGDMVWQQEAMAAYFRMNIDPNKIVALLKPIQGLERFV